MFRNVCLCQGRWGEREVGETGGQFSYWAIFSCHSNRWSSIWHHWSCWYWNVQAEPPHFETRWYFLLSGCFPPQSLSLPRWQVFRFALFCNCHCHTDFYTSSNLHRPHRTYIQTCRSCETSSGPHSERRDGTRTHNLWFLGLNHDVRASLAGHTLVLFEMSII